jgi:hypothetical protein
MTSNYGTAAPSRKKRRLYGAQDLTQSSPQPLLQSALIPPTAEKGATPRFTIVQATTILTPEANPDPATTSTRKDDTDSGDEDVGFLGSTAFNAVFTENQEHIASFSRAVEDEACGRNVQLHEQITASRKIAQPRGTRDALFVLEVLKDFPHLEKIIRRWHRADMWCCLVGPWVKDCQNSVGRHLFEKYHLSISDAARAQAAADMLHANTQTPMKMPKDVRYRDFVGYYTGGNIRWEAVGVFLLACGFSLNVLSCDEEELDFIGHLEIDKQRLMHRLLEASDTCVSFCDQALHNTDLSFWLMIENATYASQVLGDAHYTVWRKFGDLSTVIFARGLHAVRENPSDSFWLKEMRRRGVAYAYSLDKTISTFVGRPPRISKRYCSVQVPLDLEHDELALEGDELAEACAKLDSAGWNTRPRSSRDRVCSYHRLWIRAALLREDVLELCLGPPQENLREKTKNLITQCKELYESTPVLLKHSPEMLLPYSSERTFQIVREYLDSTYNEFMLERMLVRRLEENPTKLVVLSHQILAAVIEATSMRGALPTGACLSWIIVLHGVPAAAVLALELLQLNVQAVSHARIKQDLCVFISYLNTVHVPGEGNYILAEQCRKTLQHIMDKVLATEPPRSEQPVQQRVEALASGHHTTGITEDLGVYDFSWLDAAHFDHDFWDSLNSMEQASMN